MNKLKKFYERLATDSVLREKIIKINSESKSEDISFEERKNKILNKISSLASVAIGEEVTPKDFEKFEKKAEIDDNLKKVAGGALSVCLGMGSSYSPTSKQSINGMNDRIERGGGIGICVIVGIGAFGTSATYETNYRTCGEPPNKTISKSFCIILGC